MPRLEDFREMIDNSDDETLLSSGQELLREIMEISALKEKLANLEDGLAEGGKAVFYFFAAGLDEDEIVFAAERITGKLRRIQGAREAEERKVKLAEERKAKLAEEEKASAEEPNKKPTKKKTAKKKPVKKGAIKGKAKSSAKK